MRWWRRLEPGRSSPRFLAFWAAASLAELPVLWLLCGGGPLLPGWQAVLLHLGAAVLMFLAPPRDKGWFHPARHWGEPLGLIALALPGVGPLLGGALAVLHPEARHDKESYRFEDDADDPSPLAALGTPGAIREQLAQALDVVPAADALLGADPALKRGAIQVLARIRNAESIGWLLKARTDADAETRFYAVSALTQLKRDFETEIHAAEREAYAKPGELPLQLALQRIRYEYARSGLLDPSTGHAILRQCRAWLERPAERDLEALRILYLVERDLDPARALELLGRLEREDKDGSLRWTRERAVLLFELGRFAETRELLRARRERLLADEGDLAGSKRMEFRSAVLWWTHG